MKQIKIKRIKFFIVFIGIALLSGCDKTFLNREPLDSFDEESFFNNSDDLKSYVNGFYDNPILLRRMGSNRLLPAENSTDNVIGSSPSDGINTRAVSSAAPAQTGWGKGYNFIRKINFFFKNTYRVARDTESRQYTGEAFFTRAIAYFNLLSTYGGVPIILKPLNVDESELYRARDSRQQLAIQIIVDLDSAIVNLKWDAGRGRINKKAALHLKTRVGLFEGSWEYYHSLKQTPFAVSGSNGFEFLKKVVEAGDMLITQQGRSIFNGTLIEMFQIKDPAEIAGVFFYRNFSRASSLTHNVYGSFIEGTSEGAAGYSITKQLVDQFLMKDGLPEDISTVSSNDSSLRSLGQNKDPRLAQTVWMRPVDADGNTIRFFDIYDAANNTEANHAYRNSYPGLSDTQQRSPSISGYRPWKGWLSDPSEYRNGETGDIIYRYAESLLNYAEAKAILGSLTQADLDATVNLLRTRAGMPNMDLGAINGWVTTYSSKDGYKEGAPNILNEIRRERRIELALEGFRRDDLRRWAALSDVVNGFKPLGAHAQEFIDYWNSVNNELADEGFVFQPADKVKIVKGIDYGLDVTENYFNPFFNSADFGNAGAGGFIDPSRDYLSPIGADDIQLYKSKNGVTLIQNPGWIN